MFIVGGILLIAFTLWEVRCCVRYVRCCNVLISISAIALRHRTSNYAEAYLEPHLREPPIDLSLPHGLSMVIFFVSIAPLQIMCVIIDALYYFGGYLGDTYFSSWVYGMYLRYIRSLHLLICFL